MIEHFHTLVVHCDDKKPAASWVRPTLNREWVEEKKARQRAIDWTDGQVSRVAVVKHRNGSIVAVYTSK